MDLLRTPGTSVFVATGFAQKAEGATLMGQLRNRDLVVTCDWTVEAISPLNHCEKARRDVMGVKSAQVLVVLMTLPKYVYNGTFTEIGIAIGRDMPIVLISPFVSDQDADCAKNIYFHYERFIRRPDSSTFLAEIDGK
jgi:hypothetical protein